MNKVGRNDPCPCGSGKKYKQCCMQLETNQAKQVRVEQSSNRQNFQIATEYHQAGRLLEAETLYRQVLQAEPNHAEALHLSGVLACQMGNYEIAVNFFNKAIAAKSSNENYYGNLGLALQNLGRSDEAIAAYRKALALKPTYAEANNNLGYLLLLQQKLDEAAASFRKAIAAKPDYAEAHNNLGHVLSIQDKPIEAAASYRRALTLMPDNAAVYSDYLMTVQYDPSYSTAKLFADHVEFGKRFEAPLRAQWLHHQRREEKKQLRVGFVSGDFSEHPVGFFLENILAHWQRESIDIVLYSTHAKTDALTLRLQALGFFWCSLVGLSDVEAAQRVQADHIDILVDLSGHTANNRLRLFARKPAPVQMAWLGYWATTGLQAMDYIIGDRYCMPPEELGQFVEKPWYLPDTRLCFTPPAESISVGALPALTNANITFGCFNNLSKMNDAVVALWSRILLALPNSQLLLKAKQLSETRIRQSTLQRFGLHGIAAERIILEGPSPRADYLAAYNRVDIALDPFPFTGATTSVEGLWMGVPLITRKGDRLVAHQGESILHNLGMTDWIAADDDAYVALAVAHAADLAKLAELRGHLRTHLLASPLCDAPRFARNLEAAFRGMWKSYIETIQ